MNVGNEVFAYLLTFLFIGLLTDFLRRQALQAGLVDRPSARKRHRGSVPPVGGEAIFIGCLLSALAVGVPVPDVAALFAIGAIVVAVGGLDDYYGFSPQARLVAQAVASLIMALVGGATVQHLGGLGVDGTRLTLGLFAVPLTVFGTVGVINAFNMIDGMDGLSGSLALVALVGLALVAHAADAPAMLALVLIMASGIAAFLVLNMRAPWRWRASVFLGDAGSMFLGFALTWFIVRLSQEPVAAMPPVTGLWLLMVPLFDTGYVMCRRIARGRSPLHGDRQHLHHFFLRAGMSVTATLLLILAFAIAGMAAGLGGAFLGVPDRFMLAAFTGAFLLYSTAMTFAWRAHPRLSRQLARRRRGRQTLPVTASAAARPPREWPERLHTP